MDDFYSEITIYDIEKHGDKLTDFLRQLYQINSSLNEQIATITQERIEDVLIHYNLALEKGQHLLLLSLVHPNGIILPYSFEPFYGDDADTSGRVSGECIDLIIKANNGVLGYQVKTHTDNRLMASFIAASCDIRYLRHEIGRLPK